MAEDVYARTWRRFVEQGRAANADRALERAVGAGGPSIVTFIVHLHQDAHVADRIGQIQARLRLPHVRCSTPEMLHATVQGVGHTGVLSERQMAALVPAGERVFGAMAAFTMELRNANSFDSVSFVEVHDGGAIHAARARLRAELPFLVEPGSDPYAQGGVERFIPHVTIARYTAAFDNPPLVAALTPFRPFPVGTVRVSQVALLKFTVGPRDAAGDWTYLLEPMATFDLRG